MRFIEFIAQLEVAFDPIRPAAYEGEFGYVVNSEEDVARIGFATNLNPTTAARAIEARVDGLLTHHDAWDFLYGLRTETLEILKRAAISHAYVHLPLDAAPFGTAADLTEGLGLRIVDSFALVEGLPCGRIGEAPSPMPLQTIAANLRTVTGAGVRVWACNDSEVRRVAVAPGGGNMTDVLREAADLGCDTFVTGESALYSVEYAQYRRMNLIVGTHTQTEFPGMERLCERLAAQTGLELIPIREEGFEIGELLT